MNVNTGQTWASTVHTITRPHLLPRAHDGLPRTRSRHRRCTQQLIVTGTSILGIKYQDGIMLSADTLASYGSLAARTLHGRPTYHQGRLEHHRPSSQCASYSASSSRLAYRDVPSSLGSTGLIIPTR
ncbi:unnamed protein product, partial [Tilletia controversa]